MQCLAGRRILVVEDEYLIALDMGRALEEQGAEVVGPVASVSGALELIESSGRLDIAVLDINLHGEPAYPVAKSLQSKGVPFVFTTGYGASSVSREFADIRMFEKPVDPAKLAEALLS
jgi:two-component SAPR family response regulator